jgi:hypothetical protein
VLLCPAPIDAAGLPLVTVNPNPDIVTCETFTVAVPTLVIVKLCVAVLPTVTFPKPRVLVLGVKVPEFVVPGWPLEALVNPAQLDSPTMAKLIRETAIILKIHDLPRTTRLLLETASRFVPP